MPVSYTHLDVYKRQVLWVLTGENPQLSLHNPYGLVRELGYVGVDETQDIDEFVRMTNRGGFSMANQEF